MARNNKSSPYQACVLITGASRGIGRAMALMLADAGASVVAVARHKATDQTDAVDIGSAGGSILEITADVRDEAQIQAVVQQILTRYKRIDVLVNNAAIMGGEWKFTDLTSQSWNEILDTNLNGTFLCCKAVLPVMLDQGGGAIINITSGAAVRTGFLNVPYGVSKAGIDRLTLGIGEEFKDQGIACVSLSPPVSSTDTVRAIYSDPNIDSWAEPPELTAEALLKLLAKDDPMRYTGQVLSVRQYLESK